MCQPQIGSVNIKKMIIVGGCAPWTNNPARMTSVQELCQKDRPSGLQTRPFSRKAKQLGWRVQLYPRQGPKTANGGRFLSPSLGCLCRCFGKGLAGLGKIPCFHQAAHAMTPSLIPWDPGSAAFLAAMDAAFAAASALCG